MHLWCKRRVHCYYTLIVGWNDGKAVYTMTTFWSSAHMIDYLGQLLLHSDLGLIQKCRAHCFDPSFRWWISRVNCNYALIQCIYDGIIGSSVIMLWASAEMMEKQCTLWQRSDPRPIWWISWMNCFYTLILGWYDGDAERSVTKLWFKAYIMD